MESSKPTMRPFPKMVEEFARENLNLKVLSGALLALTFLAILLVIYLVRKGPVVIALDSGGVVARVDTKITDLQIEASVRQYLSYRYSWDASNISSQLGKAELFIAPESLKAFRKAMTEVEKYVRDRKVTQRVYARSIEVGLSEKKITITADRVNEFEALKAATDMRLVLHFAVSERTAANPWGIYITQEEEGGAN